MTTTISRSSAKVIECRYFYFQSTTTCTIFIRNAKITMQWHLTEDEKKKQTEFKRFWHPLQSRNFKKDRTLFRDNSSYIEFICGCLIARAALNSMPIPTNHTKCVFSSLKPTHTGKNRARLACTLFDRFENSSIFFQFANKENIRDGNNVNGIAVCHLSFVSNLLTSKRRKFHPFFHF